MKTVQNPKSSISLLHRQMPVAMAAVAVAVIAGAEVMAPDPLALPMISLLTLGLAGTISLVAWAAGAKRGGRDVTAWDIAGAFTLIGCAAAMLTQNEYALEYFIASRNR